MYSPRVIAANIAKYESRVDHKLVRLDNGTRDDWRTHLEARLAKAESREAFDRSLTKEELLFIRNERVLSSIDFSYWSHYATIQRDGGGICNFDHPWESTRILLRFIASIEEEQHDAITRGEMTAIMTPGQEKPAVPGILVVNNKSRQMASCLTAGTKVLTADLRWVPIESIKAGDMLVGFDEDSGGRGVGRKLRPAIVHATTNMEAETIRIRTADGSVITGTPQHRFLCKRRSAADFVWRSLGEMQVGDYIRRVLSVWDDTVGYEDGWFAGFLDGEGSVNFHKGTGAKVNGVQVAGLVWERALKYLNEHGYPYRIEQDDRKPGVSSKFGSAIVHKFSVGRMRDVFRLLGTVRPSRLLAKPWWHGKEMPNHCGAGFGIVTSVESTGTQRVYDLDTGTKTYIAEGLASHNTTLGRLIVMHRITTQSQRRGLAASVDDDKIQEMYDRDKLVYDNLPFFLKPALLYDEKRAHIHFNDLNSRILYQKASQKSGVGTGRQIDLHHLTELSTWAFPEALEVDFFPAIPRSIHTFGWEESTPYGRGNWWHQWSENVRKGRVDRWRYKFIPYYAELSKYRSLPIVDWQPSQIALLHAQKVHDTSPEFVGHTVMLPKENLYWWETTRQAYKDSGKLNFFYTSYSATPEESYQHSTVSAFASDLLEELRLTTRSGQSYEIRKTA